MFAERRVQTAFIPQNSGFGGDFLGGAGFPKVGRLSYCPRMSKAASRFPAPISAIGLVEAIAAGDLTPERAIAQSLEVIAAHDPAIAAFVTTAPDRSRAHAASATGPLAGLAIAVKDVYDTEDFPTQMGSPIYAGHQSPGDASVVAMARRLGATIVGKTTTTELQNRTVTSPTGNPHNLAHTPGGSSSGSAAAVAAGMVPIAFGAQTAGSVVRPAAYCGIAGFKPSYRLLPTVGMKAFSWSLDTAGLFAAGVADVAFFAECLTGRTMRVDGLDLTAPRIGVLRTHVWDLVSPDMRAAIGRTAGIVASAGAEVFDLDMPDALVDAFDAHRIIQNYQGAQALAWEMAAHRDKISPDLLAALDEGAAIGADDYDHARSLAKRGRRALKALFEDFQLDAILTPSATGAAPEGLDFTGDHSFNRLWTLMGTPCVNVPGLFDPNGMPLGVQIVAPFGRDHDCLKVAHFAERAIG
jgi:Asp-tRNA(Asn)/Glu-tRNA(Gln) amidotransferase A subunit family amidase